MEQQMHRVEIESTRQGLEEEDKSRYRRVRDFRDSIEAIDPGKIHYIIDKVKFSASKSAEI